MRIKSNIKFLTIFPITLLLLISLYIFQKQYFTFKNIQTDLKSINEIKILKEFLFDISKEREIAILNLSSNTQKTTLLYQKISKKSNDYVKNIVKLYNQNKDDQLIYKIIKDIKKIVNTRDKIANKELSYNTIFKNYDILNNDIMTKIISLKNNLYSKNSNINNYIESIQLLKEIEDERDFISNIFTNTNDIENLYVIKLFKNSNILQTLNMVDSKIKKILTNKSNKKDFLNLIKTTSNIKQELLTKGYITNFTKKEWISLEEKKITYLSFAIKNMQEKIIKDIKYQSELNLTYMLLSLFVILLSLYMIYKYNKMKKFLIDNTDLNLILKKATNDTKIEKNLNLDTTSGVHQAYKIIDTALDKIDLERKKAQNENVSKSIFLANMSHEIRTPINGIVGFTDLLKKSNLNANQKEYIDIISKSTDNLLEIINNILDLSKIESKKIEVDSITFSPIEEFENAVELFIAKAAKKDINLSLTLYPNFHNYLIGDSLKIKEVLLNLISNAIKFTPKGGDINVKIKKLNSQEEKDEEIYFEISDNGIGMSDDERSEVFNAFSQADSTITRKYGGTGLGLTISSNYVALLGGKLEVASKKNLGTKFFFTLKFKKSQPLKINEYKNAFKEVTPLIITDYQNIKLAKFLKEYFSFFTNTPSYIQVNDVQKNISLFDRSNLIIVTGEVYEKNNFSYLEKTNKKLLIIERTSEYLKQTLQTDNIKTIVEPISFFKTIEILSSIRPQQNRKSINYIKAKKPIQNYKLLIAEDNNINLRLIEEFFNQYSNISIKKALDGEYAVNLFMKEKFDLVLMDIAMPILDGISATKKIIEYEEINKLSHTPIIALTANALKGDKEKFLTEGMDEYLTKPIKEDILLDILNKFGVQPKQKDLTDLISKNKEQAKSDAQKTPKQILIYKKSEVETKIFQKVLSSTYSKIDITNSAKNFFELLEENKYEAILLDKEVNDFDFEKLLNIKKEHPETAVILFRNFETIVSNKLRKIFDEIIINSSDRAYLQTILENYVKRQ